MCHLCAKYGKVVHSAPHLPQKLKYYLSEKRIAAVLPYLIRNMPESAGNECVMIGTFRKLSHADFRLRVARVDPRFARLGEAAYAKDATPSRPFAMTLVGFGWIYMVSSISNRRDHIATSLRQGSLPEHYHDWIFGGLAVLLAASVVLLLLHVLRYSYKTGAKKKNSGGILMGALVALTLFYTPASVWDMGFGMLDGNSQQVILAANTAFEQTFPNLTLDNVAFVSSQGN